MIAHATMVFVETGGLAKMLTNVVQGSTIAALMHFAQIMWVHSIARAARDMKAMDRYALMLTSVKEALTAVTLTPAVITFKVHTGATATEDTEEMDKLAMVSARRESSIFLNDLIKVRHRNTFDVRP